MEQAHTHTYSEVRDLTVLLCRERGNSAAHAMLWEFGYKLNDLPPQHWPEFVNIAKQLLARDRMEYTTYREAVHAMMYRRASPTPTLDKLENEAEKKEGPVSCTFYDEGWNAAHDGRPFNPKATRSWRDGWNDYQDADPSHKVRLDGEVAEAVRQALTTEPQRAPLDWNKSTPFDPFPGFTVSYDTGQMVEERAHPLSRISSMSHMLGNGIREEIR